MSQQATDEELPTLEPIILDLLAIIRPRTVAEYKAGVASGAKIRTLVLEKVNVDIIELARFVARYGGEGVRLASPRPLLSPSTEEAI